MAMCITFRVNVHP